MCLQQNFLSPTSRCYDSTMAKLCWVTALLHWCHQITKLRVPNIDSIIIFSAFTFFFGINSQRMPVTHLSALIPASTTKRIAGKINQSINQSILIWFTSFTSTNHAIAVVLLLCIVQLQCMNESNRHISILHLKRRHSRQFQFSLSILVGIQLFVYDCIVFVVFDICTKLESVVLNFRRDFCNFCHGHGWDDMM